MDNNIEQKPPQQEQKFIKNIRDFLQVLSAPENKDLYKQVKFIIRLFYPSQIIKLISDIVISGLLILTVIYCADKGYIEKANVQSFLTLIIGAIIGSRFKSS